MGTLMITRRGFSAAAAAGFMAFGNKADAQPLPRLTVRTDFLPWGMHAGLHLGVVKGWFKEAGIDVEVSAWRAAATSARWCRRIPAGAR